MEEIIDPSIKNKLEKLYKDSTKFTEIECTLNKKSNISYDKYINIVKYLNYRSKSDSSISLKNNISLDIGYTKNNSSEIYRISINSLDIINTYMSQLSDKPNNIIYSTLLDSLKQNPNITLLKKIKNKNKIVDIDELDLRFRFSDEINILSEDKEFNSLYELDIMSDITFRYKQRLSLIIVDTNDCVLRIDLTDTKTSKQYKKLTTNPQNYELEVDMNVKSNKLSYLKNMFDEINKLMKVLIQNNFLISLSRSYFCIT